METRSKFFNISKAFDRVWYEGLIYKLKAISVSDNLLKLSFSYNRYENSHWELIKTGMLQRSILDSVPFFVYINDLPNNFIADVKLLDDDTSISSIVNNINVSTKEINNDLKRILKWACQ